MKSLSIFKFFVCAILFVFIAVNADATDYYVSSSGSNSNNGTSASTPWQTLSKVQSVCNAGTILPGDRILFKKGDSFTGSISIGSIWGNNAKSGTAAKPITFGYYGTGAKPVFLYPQGGTTNVTSRITMTIVGVDYYIFDGLNFTDLDTTNDKITPANCGMALYLGAEGEATTNHCIVQNVDISLCGMGIVLVGDSNKVTGCTLTNFKELKSTAGGDDDYGANALTLISASDNEISNNYISGAWASSLDYGWNGGACEVFNDCNRNKLMYNTIYDCGGVSEFGADGTNNSASDNLFAYNKIINCGGLTWCNISGNFAIQVSNNQYFNNVITENNNSRFTGPNTGMGLTAQYQALVVPDAYLFAYNGSPTATTVFNLKNNVFTLTTGIKMVRSNDPKTTHANNIYKLSGGSSANVTLAASELSTAGTVFTNTTSADPINWNFLPAPGSPAIDFGQNVGIAKDFVGNTVPAIPNSGILETTTATSTLTAVSTPGTISCYGGNTTVTVTASGGTSPYTGTGTFTVVAGTYTYTVTDAAGATTTTTVTVVQPTALTAAVVAGTAPTPSGTATATVTASGGTISYTYSLDGGTYQTSNVFQNVTVGTHSLTIKDANGCSIVKSFTVSSAVTALTILAVPGTIDCNKGTTTVTVTAGGGTTPYSGTGTFTVAAGTYSYTVTDANGTTATTSITVAEPTAIAATVAAGTGVTTATVTASGGTPSYTYSLDGGTYQSSNVFSAVAVGSHSVTVKDAKGCSFVKSFTVSAGLGSILAIHTAAGTILCNKGNTTVTVSATGGTAPYTGTGTFTVIAGTYSYTVTDANGATATTSVTVGQPTAIAVTTSAGTITVYGGTTTVTVGASGGTGVYTYSLDAGSYQSSNTFTGVTAGTHTATVKDANGCTAVKSLTITQPAPPVPLVAASTAGTISCNGGSATVTVSASGGTAPYTGTGNFNVAAGTYNYTVTDATGATATTAITVTQPTAIVATATATTITIAGGVAVVTVSATGGTAPYTYEMGSGTYQSGNTFSNIPAGAYSITVKDANGCTKVTSLTITQPSSTTFKIVLVSKSNLSCRNKNDGKIVVTATGGTPPYSYRINYGSYRTSGTFSNLKPGFYIVTAKDAANRLSTIYVTISNSTVHCSASKDPVSDSDGSTFAKGEVPGAIEGLKINAYPNPTTTEFSLVIDSDNPDAEAQILVMNMNGQKVYETKTKTNQKINFGNNFVSGIYFVRVTQGNKSETLKLVKAN